MRFAKIATSVAIAAAVLGGGALAAAPANAATVASTVDAAKPAALTFPGLLVNSWGGASAVGMDATPGATVTVAYAGRIHTGTAGANGFWSVDGLQLVKGQTTFVAFQTVDGVRSATTTYFYAG